MEPVVNKPHWLSQDVWGRLLQKSGLTGGCAKCGTRVGITVFPIKPYWQGGGGSGGVGSNSGSSNGGAGAPGIIIITEYL